MVFRGVPSKACQRCRDRRLKCDLGYPSCSSCMRAKTPCSGYRDSKQLRIYNETQAVELRAAKKKRKATPLPPCLPLSLEVQAREAFFLYYVTGTAKSWDFLRKFLNPPDTPHHLNLSIDAVSLAYFSDLVQSDGALLAARERYVSAIRLTTEALQCSRSARKKSTLVSVLLLDLYEKRTNRGLQVNKSWASHIHGALALVKLVSLTTFLDPSESRLLGRLTTNVLISCVVFEAPVPEDLQEVREHIGKIVHVDNLKWKLSNLMISYADLRSQISKNQLTVDERICLARQLDLKLEALLCGVSLEWQFKSCYVSTPASNADRVWTNKVDIYPNRVVTQTWNVARIVRILLNQIILEDFTTLPQDTATKYGMILEATAKKNIQTLAKDICASIPQYLDCHYKATLNSSATTTIGVEATFKCQSSQNHSPSDTLDCYTTIFPLYVAGYSKAVSAAMTDWVIRQLQHMGSHFGIRNASLVAQSLVDRTYDDPWKMYNFLGSYAFVA